jgi:hypothetical protein
MEQWLFTFVSATGEVARVERLDPDSGRRQELSEAEYGALESYLEPLPAEPAPALSSAPSSRRAAAVNWAYWRGVADCAALYRRRAFG